MKFKHQCQKIQKSKKNFDVKEKHFSTMVAVNLQRE